MQKIDLKNEIKIDLIQLLKVKSRVILNYYYLKLMLLKDILNVFLHCLRITIIHVKLYFKKKIYALAIIFFLSFFFRLVT